MSRESFPFLTEFSLEWRRVRAFVLEDLIWGMFAKTECTVAAIAIDTSEDTRRELEGRGRIRRFGALVVCHALPQL